LKNYLSFFSLTIKSECLSPKLDSKYYRFGLYLLISECSEKCNDERGLGINGFQDPFIKVRLQEIEGKGLLQITRDRIAFRLTQAGIKYCKQLTVG
jgi:hypothetical protein